MKTGSGLRNFKQPQQNANHEQRNPRNPVIVVFGKCVENCHDTVRSLPSDCKQNRTEENRTEENRIEQNRKEYK